MHVPYTRIINTLPASTYSFQAVAVTASPKRAVQPPLIRFLLIIKK